MELEVSLDSVCRIIQRAREIEAQVPEDDADEGSNATDDGNLDVLEDADEEENAVDEELRVAIEDLAEDEQAELIALTLVGRGTYEGSEWDDALAAAQDEMPDAVEFLTELPMLSSELEAGLAAFGLNCDAVGQRG